MRIWRMLAILGFAVVPAVVGVVPVSAEPFLDVYAGAAFTSDADTEVTVGPFSFSRDTEWKASIVAGGRVGYWFEGLPSFGLALDGSWFRPEEDAGGHAEIDVVAVSLLGMGRLQLDKNAQFPKGRFQPYVAAGVGLFYTDFSREPNVPTNLPGVRSGPGSTTDDTSLDVGADLRAGLTFMFTPSVGVFGEYRFTYVSPEWDAGLQGTEKMDLETHHVVGGVTLRFY